MQEKGAHAARMERIMKYKKQASMEKREEKGRSPPCQRSINGDSQDCWHVAWSGLDTIQLRTTANDEHPRRKTVKIAASDQIFGLYPPSPSCHRP